MKMDDGVSYNYDRSVFVFVINLDFLLKVFEMTPGWSILKFNNRFSYF